MTRLRVLLSRIAGIIFRRQREERLSEEVQAHLDLLADDYVAQGMSPAAARLAARKAFGGVDQVKMRYRDQRGLPMVDAWLQDVRFAIRLLARDRAFALTVILVLGVGIGVNNMFFTLVYAHKFRGLPIDRPDRVLSISTFDDRMPDRQVSPAELDDLRQAHASFTGLAAYVNGVVTVGDEGRAPDRFDAAYLSANAFPQIGITPVMGRGPSTDEDRAGAAPVVLLGASVWQSRYAGDPGILGRAILINGTPATVIGVMPDRSGVPSVAAVWLPLGQFAGLSPNRDARTLRVFGRLRDTATVSDARAEVEAAFGRFATAYPDTNRNLRARVVPINERLLGDLAGWEPFIMAGVIVILVACANVANLMIARAMQRSPEIAIRTSLGASRGRIVRQLLVEATALAALGGLVGGLLSVGGVQLFQSAIPAGTLPYWFDYSMDAGVFGALVGISLLTVVVFGLIPAMQASRTDVNRTLKDGGRSNTGHGGMRVWTAAFLTGELALAMIMLTQVALAALTARAPIPTDAAIDTTAVMTTTITLPASGFPTADHREEFFRQVKERLSGRAGVTAVSRTTLLPGAGGRAAMRRIEVKGQPRAEGVSPSSVQVIDVAPSYFATLGVAFLKGRDFVAGDGSRAAQTAIVNNRFAEVYLNGDDPIGSRIAVTALNVPGDAPPQWLTIVGMAPEIRQQGPGGRTQQTPVVYVPIAATSPVTSILMVRHTVDPVAVASLLRTEVQAVDPNVALYRMQTLAGAVRDAQWNARVSSYLATTVCLLSVLLAMIGLYAVTAQRVTIKTQEIGLRMALGARSPQVMRLILGDLRVPLILGLLLATAGAVAWDRAFSPGDVNVYASAPRTLMTIAAFITAVVVLACLAPLRRATQMNPTTALRHE